MPLEERRARQEALFRIVCENDIQHWPDRFLSALTGSETLEHAAPRRSGIGPAFSRAAAAMRRMSASRYR
jgi:trehalose-6-phosphate synthase